MKRCWREVDVVESRTSSRCSALRDRFPVSASTFAPLHQETVLLRGPCVEAVNRAPSIFLKSSATTRRSPTLGSFPEPFRARSSQLIR